MAILIKRILIARSNISRLSHKLITSYEENRIAHKLRISSRFYPRNASSQPYDDCPRVICGQLDEGRYRQKNTLTRPFANYRLVFISLLFEWMAASGHSESCIAKCDNCDWLEFLCYYASRSKLFFLKRLGKRQNKVHS